MAAVPGYRGRVTHLRSLSAARGLILGLDVLLATLLVVAVLLAPLPVRWLVMAVSAALVGVYVWGRITVRVHGRSVDSPRGAWRPDGVWIIALLVLWVGLLWLSPAALWIAFPFMLLQMHVLGPHRGVLAVAVTTVVAVADGVLVQAGADDAWTGYVLGPALGAGVAVGVVLGIEAFIRESQGRQRTVEELTRAREHLAQAERARAVTDERARLARDIHDTLAQSLSAIELLLRSAETSVGSDDERARSRIAQARDAARESLAEARRVVHDLTPPDLDGNTLLDALRRVADHMANSPAAGQGRRRELTVTVHATGPARRLPVPVETALLRIAQSALANVSEHADAERARLTLNYQPGSVTLHVVDDGRGFDPAAVPERGERGFGIAAIGSRVHELGGTLTLETAPGEGTALAATVPAPWTEEP